jgi:3-hydroxyacyl-CoA dehydrogenase
LLPGIALPTLVLLNTDSKTRGAPAVQDGSMGSGLVRQEVRGAVLVLRLDAPPENALTQEVRAGLATGLDFAVASADIHAVVLTGTGAHFSAGVECASARAQRLGPDLVGLCLRIENFPKPVVAAIQGDALGGGLELALAAQFRIALARASVALPEVRLGILPHAGATQRLPRLIGAEQALRMMLGGGRISAAEALALGILDHVVEDKLIDAAVTAADRLAQGSWSGLRAGLRREGMRDALVFQESIRRARAGLAGALPAPARIVDCIEAAALLPYDQGLAMEQVAFEDLAATPEAQALHHATQVERRAVALPPTFAPVPLSHVAIWGASAGSVELARAALGAGLRVTLIEPMRDRLVQAVEKIAAAQELGVAEGRLSVEARDADWARLRPVLSPEAAAGADLLLGAPEAGAWPQDVPCPPVVALGGLADAVLTPPNPQQGLAELALRSGAAQSLQTLALSVGQRLGWRVVLTGPGGPIERRLRATLSAVIAWLEAQGVARAAIAAALSGFGLGVPRRQTQPPAEAREVVPLCLAALANQGAKLLAEGVALRPGDIDAVAMASGLLPRWQGGPMFQADRRGLMVLRAVLRQHKDRAPQLFTPAALLDDLIAEGRDFADLNRD